MGIEAILLISRQGKVRLTKFYEYTVDKKERGRMIREVTSIVLSRQQKMSNVIEWKGKKVIYKRYASLFFVALVSSNDNELSVLETIHHFVEVLDKYFGNVCELDIIFNFHKAYYILDELLIGGELQESSKREILRVCAAQDDLMEDENNNNNGAPGTRPNELMLGR